MAITETQRGEKKTPIAEAIARVRDRVSMKFTISVTASLVSNLKEIDPNSVLALKAVATPEDYGTLSLILRFNIEEPGAENTVDNRIKAAKFLKTCIVETFGSIVEKKTSNSLLDDEEQEVWNNITQANKATGKKNTLATIKVAVANHFLESDEKTRKAANSVQNGSARPAKAVLETQTPALTTREKRVRMETAVVLARKQVPPTPWGNLSSQYGETIAHLANIVAKKDVVGGELVMKPKFKSESTGETAKAVAEERALFNNRQIVTPGRYEFTYGSRNRPPQSH